MTVNNTTLTCGVTRNDFDIELLGEHCECHINGMAIGSERMHIDNDTVVMHRAPRCRSNQLFKYVMDDESSGAFEGSITVMPDAPLHRGLSEQPQYTCKYQRTHALQAAAHYQQR